MILSFEAVSAPAGRRRELRDVVLHAIASQCVVGVGPSAARAAMADLALGFREPTAGRVTVDGTPWSEMRPAVRARVRASIGSALDRASWISDLDIDDNLTLAEQIHERRSAAEVREEAADIAARLGIGGIPDGHPHECSPDLLRALSIVRALVGRRRLLLLEDPGRLLPASTRAALEIELKDRQAAGCAILFLTAGRPSIDLDTATTVSLSPVKPVARLAR